MNDSAMSAYYELEGIYSLKAHEALLFRKIKPVDRAIVDRLSERLRAFYPDVPFVYKPNYFLALMESDETLAEYNYWDNSLRFQKPEGGQATFILNDTGSFSQLQFDILCYNAEMELVAENQDGVFYRAAVSEGFSTCNIDITGSGLVSISIQGAGAETVIIYYGDDSLS